MARRNDIDELFRELDIAEETWSDLDVEEQIQLLNEKINRLYRGGGQANRNIQVDGINVLTPWTDINLVSGTGITLTATPNNTTHYTVITVDSSSTGGGYQQPTGTVNGTNQVFVFSIAPSVISVDQGRVMQQTSSDGTVNWTGTTTVTLAIAPNFDVFGLA